MPDPFDSNASHFSVWIAFSSFSLWFRFNRPFSWHNTVEYTQSYFFACSTKYRKWKTEKSNLWNFLLHFFSRKQFSFRCAGALEGENCFYGFLEMNDRTSRLLRQVLATRSLDIEWRFLWIFSLANLTCFWPHKPSSLNEVLKISSINHSSNNFW
jgi:hypothetical protein